MCVLTEYCFMNLLNNSEIFGEKTGTIILTRSSQASTTEDCPFRFRHLLRNPNNCLFRFSWYIAVSRRSDFAKENLLFEGNCRGLGKYTYPPITAPSTGRSTILHKFHPLGAGGRVVSLFNSSMPHPCDA